MYFFIVKIYCINIRFIQNPNIKGFFKNIDFEFGFTQKTIFYFHTEKNLAKRIDLKIYNKINQSRHEKSFKTPLVSCAPLTNLINYLFYLHQ